MARNGSGVYTPPAADYPAVASTLIESTKFNNVIDDISTAISGSIAADGQTTVTANLPMNSKKFTGLASGSARTDSSALGQVQDGTVNWVDGGGTADAITATYSPAITALIDGQVCFVRATAANATTTPTFAPNGLTARTIVMQGGAALVAGSIGGDGHELMLRYDLANTQWELLNPKPVEKAAIAGSASQVFSVEAATADDHAVSRVFGDARYAAIADVNPVGTIIDFAGTSPPSGYLTCPTSQTNISRTTYAALFAVIGTTWGEGDGSTTFGMPWFAADYAAVQANANVGTASTGEVKAHTHTLPNTLSNITATASTLVISTAGTGNTSGSTGGAANLAAGVRVLKCVKY